MYADRILEYSPKLSKIPIASPKFEITPIPTISMNFDRHEPVTDYVTSRRGDIAHSSKSSVHTIG